MVDATVRLIRRAIIISALGYFIDVFDIQLFAVLRVASLSEIGVGKADLPRIAGNILNLQMVGMILGALLWGYIGDRFGRLRALYGSILVYSIGTLLCAIVHDPTTYGLYRFLAGFGLAGETGAAITLVAELMSPQKRGWGITIVGGFGFLGPVAAVCVSWFLDWRMTYVIAGVLGLMLLVLRKTLAEPILYRQMAERATQRGSWKFLLRRRQGRILLCCIIVGIPGMFAASILNFFSLELGHAILREGQSFDQKTSLILYFFGLAVGNFSSSSLSQLWRSRRKAIAASLGFGMIVVISYLIVAPHTGISVPVFYGINFCLGLLGYFLPNISMTAEQFGTNIRATATIVVSNFIRGATIPMVLVFRLLTDHLSIVNAAAVMGITLFACALLALSRLEETHGRDLDYLEAV